MKKRLMVLMLVLGMAAAVPAAAEEITAERIEAMEERIALLEEKIAKLEALLGVEMESEAQTELAADADMELLEEPYTLEIGIGTVLRETAEEKGKVMTKLRIGSEVTVLAKSEEWLMVTYKDKTGYVNRALVDTE